ncbi:MULTISPECIES: hypothetical protein [unclassified Streptococcus]|uniref:hypothetical protein n=1 Tax=unclassified Streptococcus TaxID=2608887 RepID=UPI0011B82FD4|nr:MULTISPECIES: hypothetical protein [unclassified Streptococcus]TWS94241.1 hypothetical protein FRX52_04940 [Streptococcus sp. sy018]TWT14757.1 hypothetical protein FRX51_04085 [Streptococcus sp. sy010]
MNPQELLEQIKEMIAKKDFSAAQDFINENKDNLGEYFEQAKALVSGGEGVNGILDKVKGLFGK